jgi:hypothetical protein
MECLNSVECVLEYISINNKPFLNVTLTEYKKGIWIIKFEGSESDLSIFVYKKIAFELLRYKYFIMSVYSLDNYNVYNFNSRKTRQCKISVLGESRCDNY